MPAFNYGFKLDPMSGEMRYQPILNRNTSSSQTGQTTGYSPLGQYAPGDQFNMSGFGFGAPPNTGYNGFGGLTNTAYNGFNPATGGYGNTGFPQASGGTFGSGYTNIPGPAMFSSPEQMAYQNTNTFNTLLPSLSNSLGGLVGLDLPGITDSGPLSRSLAQQGYTTQGGSPFMQTAATSQGNPWMSGYNGGNTGAFGPPQGNQLGFARSVPYQLSPNGGQAQYPYGATAFNQQYQPPFNTTQYPFTQTAQGYYGQPSQAFGNPSSPFVTGGGYQQPMVNYNQYVSAQPYYEQPGAFTQQGTYPQQQGQGRFASAQSVGGFANTPLGQAAGGYGDLGDVDTLLARADRNVNSAQRITDLLDNNKLSASLKNTTTDLNAALDAQKNMGANDILALSLNLNDILKGLNLG